MLRRELSSPNRRRASRLSSCCIALTTTTTLSQRLGDSAPVAQEARRFLDGLTFVHAEHNLCAVLALVGVHECHAWGLRKALNRCFMPRGGTGGVLVEEQPPGLYLLNEDAYHEVQMHACAYQLATYHFRVSLAVVQRLP